MNESNADEVMLTNELSDLDVSNVYLYVGDAVRYDYAPDPLFDLGCTVKTIASSTHSPTSFASLSTGNYPPGHGVETFTDQVHPDVSQLFDLFEGDTGFINSIFAYATPEHGETQDPIFSVLDREPSEQISLDQANTPFFVMERGPGGHAPYGEYDGSASDYFQQRGSAPQSRCRDDYRRSIDLDFELFRKRYETLEERGLLQNTLVIYTSDHGELLGERGLLGHNAPMCPELVYVASTFIHPRISEGDVTETAIHHVDITSTIIDILGMQEGVVESMDGNSMLRGIESTPQPTFWSNSFFPRVGTILTGDLKYQGVWDAKGGYTTTSSHIGDRLATYLGKLVKSSKRTFMLRHAASSFTTYAKSGQRFGDPRFSEDVAESTIEEATTNPRESIETSLSKEGQDHLEDLGYLE